MYYFSQKKMRKGDRRRSVFKKRKGVGIPKPAYDVSTEDVSLCESDSRPRNEVEIGLGQPTLEPEAEVISASKTKIGDIDSKYKSLSSESTNEESRPNVNIIVNLQILSEVLSSAVKCVKCDSVGLKISVTKNQGLCSEISLLCSSCSFSNSFISSPNLPESKLYDINVGLAYGLRSIGKGRQTAKQKSSAA